MTETQARRAVKIIKEMDSITEDMNAVAKKFELAERGDLEALNWLATIAHSMAEQNIRHLHKDLESL